MADDRIEYDVERETDSHFLNLYNALQDRIAKAKTGVFPYGTSREKFKAQCEIDLEYIEMGWENILFDRRRGELTDPSRIESVEQIATELARFNSIPIKFDRRSPPIRNDGDFSPYWRLDVIFSGERNNLDLARWWRYIDKIFEQAKQFDFLDDSVGRTWITDYTKTPPDYEDRDYDRPGAPFFTGDDAIDFDYEEDDEERENNEKPRDQYTPIDPYQTPCAVFMIDTWMWDGPPRRRRRRKPGQGF